MGYYSSGRYVPTGQEVDGLGDFFKAAKPALMGFAKRAGKSVLSAGAAVLKDVIEGKNAGESAKKAFLEAGMSLLDDTVSRATGKKRKAPGSQGGKIKNKGVPATFLTNTYNSAHTHAATYLTLTARHGRF